MHGAHEGERSGPEPREIERKHRSPAVAANAPERTFSSRTKDRFGPPNRPAAHGITADF